MSPAIKPMNLGDIFDRLFKLLGKTFLRNLTLTAIIIAPCSLILAYGMESFFGNIAEIVRAGSGLDDFRNPGMLLKGIGMFFLTGLIFMLGYLAATLGVTIISCGEMSGREISWNEALNLSFGVRLGRLLGQQVLFMLAATTAIFFSYFLLILGLVTGSRGLGGGSVLLFLAAICIAVFLWIRWAFAIQAIAWEESGVIGAFQRSWRLVKDYWWRTFGILLLLSILIQFALSIVTTPISMFALWDFYAKYFELLGSFGGEKISETDVFGLFDSIGFRMGLISGLSTIFSLVIMPLITVVMYFDLRARRGEFSEEEPPEDSRDESEGEVENDEGE